MPCSAERKPGRPGEVAAPHAGPLAGPPLLRRLCRVAATVIAVAAVGCGGAGSVDVPADDPERERFVAAYVALRRAALRSPGRVLSAEEGRRIMAQHGTSSGEMLGFADEHGDDLDYMEAVWSEIDARIREAGADAPVR